ncbi:MAG: AI-2E family transporter [Aliifodinibius sp.]|nr:AI-2E family transporter [Fodinibius sp.]
MSSETREKIVRDNRIVIALLSIICIMGIGAVLYQARSIVLPFALAVFISYVLNPLISFFERRRVPGAISILLAVIITFLILGVVALLVNNSIQSFAAEFPKYEKRFDAILRGLFQYLNIPPELFTEQMKGTERLQWLTSQDWSLTGIITNVLRSIAGFLSNTFLVLLFLVFILMGRNKLIRKLEFAFKPQVSKKVSGVCSNINIQIQRYLLAKTLVSLMTAIMATFVLYMFNVEFAMIWGILTFLLNFIPNIGSFLATILPVSLAFIQFNDYVNILWIVVSLVGVQLVMGNIVDPRLVSRSLNLSPLVVLFSLIFWGWLLGIVGMFLAVPLMVSIKIAFENIESLRFISVLMSSHR